MKPAGVHRLLTGHSSFMEMSSTACLVCSGDLKVIIDTGSKDARRELLWRLRELGVRPEEIDIVANTHVHMDHCWNNGLFPNAEYYCSENEYRMMMDIMTLKHPQGAYIEEILARYLSLQRGNTPDSLKRTVVEFLYSDGIFEAMLRKKRIGPSAINQAGLRAVETPGHTDGHTAFILNGGASRSKTIFSGDAIIDKSHFRSKKQILFTRNWRQYADSKLKMERFEGLFYPGHGPEFVVFDDSGRNQNLHCAEE